MKTLTKENIADIVGFFKGKSSITSLTSNILRGETQKEDREGNMVLPQFFDLPDPVKTTVRMEVRIIGKDEKTTYADLNAIDTAVFNEFANAVLPIELATLNINNIVPRQLVPELGTKDRKEALRDYVFYF